jgi:hypothetical protein
VEHADDLVGGGGGGGGGNDDDDPDANHANSLPHNQFRVPPSSRAIQGATCWYTVNYESV